MPLKIDLISILITRGHFCILNHVYAMHVAEFISRYQIDLPPLYAQVSLFSSSHSNFQVRNHFNLHVFKFLEHWVMIGFVKVYFFRFNHIYFNSNAFIRLIALRQVVG